MRKITLLMAAVLTLCLPMNAFALESSPESYNNIKGTLVYTDQSTNRSEQVDCVNAYSMIPGSVRNTFAANGVKIYLVGNSENSVKIVNGQKVAGNTPPDIYVGMHPNDFSKDPYGPAYIEDDPYDLNNLKLVDHNGKKCILWHGSFLPVIDENNINWERYRQSYIEEASCFGPNYKPEGGDSGSETVQRIQATTIGPTVEYDGDNNMAYCRTVSVGRIEYYSNNELYTPEAIIHEAGHMLDFLAPIIEGHYSGNVYGISSRQEWQSLYAANKDRMAGIDYVSGVNVPMSAYEAFADAFRLTYQKPAELYQACPDVYNFIVQTVSQYCPCDDYNAFDYADYAMRYPDVYAAVGADKQALWNHYQAHKADEGRVAKFK